MANVVPVWLTASEIRKLQKVVYDIYQLEGGGVELQDIWDKLALAEKSVKTKRPASDWRRKPRKK